MNTSTEATRTAPHSDDFQIEALSPVMGASIRGLDVSIPLSEKIVERLKQLLLDYKVLCFREQHLSLDAQLAFTRCWGTPLEHTMADQLAGVRNHVQIATNVGPDGKPNGKNPVATAMRWHTDRSWRPDPALATLLYGVETPRTGGETRFCNTSKAYEALSPAMKLLIDGLRVVHSVAYSRRAAGGPEATKYELHIGQPTPHPLVRRHPETGEKAIFLGSHAWMIEGMSEEDSRTIIDELMAFTTQDAFVYQHPWRRHDLVIWDNRCTLHAATPYDTAREVRITHRTVVQGEPTLQSEQA
ncbi:TauD/TfdA family dioxygenase [Variovorax paradoxus]|uniref:TauD/TfdA dioxygenase family protein n=1 Tax=Variovorax paradoxus TaxID=34073 RepID=UPI001934AD73|nr:TauD/TfdA family dioxygenase [Variovorax paradoxus]